MVHPVVLEGQGVIRCIGGDCGVRAVPTFPLGECGTDAGNTGTSLLLVGAVGLVGAGWAVERRA